MYPILQPLAQSLAKNVRILPSPLCCQQLVHYSDNVQKTGQIKENVRFLKSQREQLKQLRSKILKERNLIKERIEQLDKEIESIKKKNSDRDNKNS